MRRQDIWVDFGLSGLMKWFASPWVSEASEEEIITDVADWGNGAYAPTLLEDALRLLESPLPDQMISLLYRATIGLPYGPDEIWQDGRGLLDDIVRISTDRIRRDHPSFTPAQSGPPAGGPLKEAVLEEIHEVAPVMRDAIGARGNEAITALEQLVAEVDPDLGFRFFLRVLKAHLVPITEAQYLRYHELGERFGFHELVVDDGTLHSVPNSD